MMKIAIMQPYFFPYIGYWQLIGSVDKFVIFDDVNFRKRSFINRNYILLNKKKHLITLCLKGASQNKLINEIRVGGKKGKLLKTIWYAYKKSPYFRKVFPVIEEILNSQEENLSKFLFYSIKIVSEYLGIKTDFLFSSKLKKKELKGKDTIIEICKILQAETYINPIGGVNIYKKEDFFKESITLKFLKTENIKYKHFSGNCIENLSIIDVMMFNNIKTIQNFLREFYFV